MRLCPPPPSPMPFNYTEQEAMRTLGGHELMEVEKGMKTDPDECCGNREVEARKWAVFPGGMLKEFKPEHNDMLNKVKSENDGQTINSELTRSWVVCPGGVLKEVKPEHNE